MWPIFEKKNKILWHFLLLNNFFPWGYSRNALHLSIFWTCSFLKKHTFWHIDLFFSHSLKYQRRKILWCLMFSFSDAFRVKKVMSSLVYILLSQHEWLLRNDPGVRDMNGCHFCEKPRLHQGDPDWNKPKTRADGSTRIWMYVVGWESRS